MNTVTLEKKEKMLKTLAILGFLAIIGFIAWASVQIVAYAPKAFNSLASLAASMDHYQDTIGDKDTKIVFTDTIEKTEAGKPMLIRWNKQPQTGTYSLSYKCVDGIGIDVVDTEGLRSIACDTHYTLGDTDTVTVIIDSLKQTETPVSYSISYTDQNNVGPVHTGENTVSVINTSIGNTDPVLSTNDGTEWKDSVSTPTKKPTPVVASTPTPKPATTYTNVVSDPKGYTDLASKFVATGLINGNTFKASSLKQNSEGAFQFTITNFGTKTSQVWSYTVTLPDGDAYTSPLQSPLLPGEQATIALGFPTTDVATYTFVVVAAEMSDVNLANNSLTQRVSFSK